MSIPAESDQRDPAGPVRAGRVAVIGVGNPYRCDDGVGPAAIAAIERLRPADAVLTVCDGEPGQLLEAWSAAELAVVIDAVLCEPATPGRIHRSTLDRGSTLEPGADALPTASTHGLGIPDALRLAEALDRAPRRLVVFAVEAADIGFGTQLSPAVAAAVPELVRAVLTEVNRLAPLQTAIPGSPAPAVAADRPMHRKRVPSGSVCNVRPDS